jgi:hypothetical protein
LRRVYVCKQQWRDPLKSTLPTASVLGWTLHPWQGCRRDTKSISGDTGQERLGPAENKAVVGLLFAASNSYAGASVRGHPRAAHAAYTPTLSPVLLPLIHAHSLDCAPAETQRHAKRIGATKCVDCFGIAIAVRVLTETNSRKMRLDRVSTFIGKNPRTLERAYLARHWTVLTKTHCCLRLSKSQAITACKSKPSPWRNPNMPPAVACTPNTTASLPPYPSRDSIVWR